MKNMIFAIILIASACSISAQKSYEIEKIIWEKGEKTPYTTTDEGSYILRKKEYTIVHSYFLTKEGGQNEIKVMKNSSKKLGGKLVFKVEYQTEISEEEYAKLINYINS